MLVILRLTASRVFRYLVKFFVLSNWMFVFIFLVDLIFFNFFLLFCNVVFVVLSLCLSMVMFEVFVLYSVCALVVFSESLFNFLIIVFLSFMFIGIVVLKILCSCLVWLLMIVLSVLFLVEYFFFFIRIFISFSFVCTAFFCFDCNFVIFCLSLFNFWLVCFIFIFSCVVKLDLFLDVYVLFVCFIRFSSFFIVDSFIAFSFSFLLIILRWVLCVVCCLLMIWICCVCEFNFLVILLIFVL